MTYDLVRADDPILHAPAKDVLGFDQLIEETVMQLQITLDSIPNAAGLAAPQVGIPLRIAVLRSRELPVIINPVIISTSEGTRSKTERCLSYPGQSFRVRRFNSVTVAYHTMHGVRRVVEAHGQQAQLLQHEIDHLAGKTIAD